MRIPRSLPKRDEADLKNLWQDGVLLKRDVFSSVIRGRFKTNCGDVDAVLRRIDLTPWWTRPIARLLLARERKALRHIESLALAPPLLWSGKDCLVRGWINGIVLHLAQPYNDAVYFRDAKAILRKLHRAGVCHNDLAKSQNWLRSSDGRPFLTDFQLAIRFRRRHKLFRIAAYEDLRHLLKHKRHFAPGSLTSRERAILARKSAITIIWMATGKKLYMFATRGLLGFADREGAGLRLTKDAPIFVEQIKSHPAVADAVIVTYPDSRAHVGLYAFIERRGGPPFDETQLANELRKTVDNDEGRQPPEHFQIVDALPRDDSGHVRVNILQLIATNQIDMLDSLIRSDGEAAIVHGLLLNRKNYRDRRVQRARN
jgi:serine/threonine protein kinase